MLLGRTNVGVMVQVMELLSGGHRVALAGGGDSLRALALAARDLKEGRRTTHPDLVLSPPGGDLQDYAAYDPADGDLQPLVDLVDTHGADAILAAVAHLAPEDQCEVTVSTAHQAEGREWAQVKIADDLTPPSDGPPDGLGQGTVRRIDDKEFCLAYVAVTRTRRRLDIGPSWIKEHRPVLSHRGDARGGFLAVGDGAGEKFSIAVRAVHRRPPPPAGFLGYGRHLAGYRRGQQGDAALRSP